MNFFFSHVSLRAPYYWMIILIIYIFQAGIFDGTLINYKAEVFNIL